VPRLTVISTLTALSLFGVVLQPFSQAKKLCRHKKVSTILTANIDAEMVANSQH